MVYYRKYRPQKISELDLTTVREKLTSILKSEELPHAFLFTGSKGLGKTSAARILAKAVNCKNKKKGDVEPCNECEICTSITNGSNLDVLEIDAASNGGVDEIRVLRERVKFASSTLKKKVYIIDEVHMLSTGAFNALLKTLEEPPSHVLFVLATTELHKLPGTVVSRTFQIQFEKPTEEEVLGSLQRIVKGEGLRVNNDVLHDVFELADGSFRDGAKILEELSLASDKKNITKELVEKIFKTSSIHDEVFNLLNSLSKRDAKKSLEIISKLSKNGVDFKNVVERMVDHLRGLLMLRNNIKSEEKDVKFSLSEIRELLELSNEAYGELRYAVMQQLPLELLVVKFCIIDVQDTDKKVKDFGEKPKDEKTESVEEEKEEKGLSEDILQELTQRVNDDNKLTGALLKSCREALVKDRKLFIITPFSAHAEKLRDQKALSAIENAAEQITGKKVGVEIEVVQN